MRNRRLEFHEILVGLLGSRNVYFQPPSSVMMQYPCVVYSRSRMSMKHADNLPYTNMIGYMVSIIDPDPDSEIIDRLGSLPHSKFDRHYTADNLNHDVFNIYY